MIRNLLPDTFIWWNSSGRGENCVPIFISLSGSCPRKVLTSDKLVMVMHSRYSDETLKHLSYWFIYFCSPICAAGLLKLLYRCTTIFTRFCAPFIAHYYDREFSFPLVITVHLAEWWGCYYNSNFTFARSVPRLRPSPSAVAFKT